MADFTGTAGNDLQDGTGADEVFDYSQGGKDTLNGLGGADTFLMGAALDFRELIDGGDGYDILSMDGDYSSANAIVFGFHTIQNVEEIDFAAGHNYTVTLSRGNMTDGQTLRIDASALATPNLLNIDASAAVGILTVFGGGGNDTIRAGSADDVLYGGNGNDLLIGGGGVNAMYGGIGNDNFGARAADYIYGGDGNDTATLNPPNNDGTANVRYVDMGDGDDAVTLPGAGMIDIATTLLGGTGIDTLTINSGAIINLPTLDVSTWGFEKIASALVNGTDADNDFDFSSIHVVTSNPNFGLNGLGGDDTLRGVIDAKNILVGGEGNDTLTGGRTVDTLIGGDGRDTLLGARGADQLDGGLGKDRLNGSLDNDIFIYHSAAESTSFAHDILIALDARGDKIDAPLLPTAIDTVIVGGQLDKATLNVDMAAAVNAGTLGVQHAVLFTPDSGSYAGKTFILMDANGTAGYQEGADYVFELATPVNLDHFSVNTFI